MSLTKLRTLVVLTVIVSIAQLSAQTFELTFHEYDNFPNIDEIVHGDFNSDGSIDFIISGNSIGELKIGIGDGLGKPEFRDLEDDLSVFEMEVIDFDEDGDLDLVGSAPFEDASFVWTNDGAANFTREELPFSDYSAIHFEDLNGDGNKEIIVGFQQELNIYNLNNGNPTLISTIFSDVFSGAVGSIISLDYNNDGAMDIVSAFNRDGLVLFSQGSGLSFDEQVLYSDTTNDDELFTSDFNNDGVPDFVLQSEFERSSIVLISTGNSEYEEISIPNQYGPNLFTTIADFDQDGTVEILHANSENPVNAGVSFFEYDQASSELNQVIIAEDHADTEDGGIVDLDNDGDLDFYLYTNDFFDTGLAFYTTDGAISNCPPSFFAAIDDEVMCLDGTEMPIQFNANLMNPPSGPPVASGSWSGNGISPDGLFDPTGLSAQDNIELSYSIEYPQNCTYSISVFVTLLEAPALSVITIDPDCFLEQTGAVELLAAGGTPPYTYQIEGLPSSNSGFFDVLNPGSYTAEVTDSNGCNTSLQFDIIPAQEPPLGIDGPLTIIASGTEEYRISDFPANLYIDEVIWTINGVIICSGMDCQLVVISAADYPDGFDLTATVIYNNGCIIETTIRVDVITSSTHEISNSIVNIFPNPTTEYINIHIDGPLEYSITLYDLNGKIFFDGTNQSRINLNDTESGLYILMIEDMKSSSKIIERVMIQK